jgi:phosphate transport system ATP-binding protein
MVKEKIKVRDLNIYFGEVHALKNLNLDVYQNEILAIIGPANSGKTSFLRMLNRLNELQENFSYSGKIYIDEKEIEKIPVQELRQRVGMVFALPIPLPISIYDNVAYGPKMRGIRKKSKLDEIVERALKEAYLWDEVKDRLKENAMSLSGGQQQRLCIARTLANEPEVILFDEPCSGLDPVSTAKVEDTMLKLKQNYTIILVTNNTKQAARVSDRTAFFLMGELVEVGPTAQIFTTPKDKRTEDYISGKFG